jgi:hypothetical protein
MPIKLPNLDDRAYGDLVQEAISAIPNLAPAWTDHNPSNPGIALVELFAWLTEMILYRTNQVPERSYEVFLKLLNGPAYERPALQSLDDAIHDTMVAVRERFRAVTTDDYEFLALNVFRSTTFAVNRVRCLPERNLEAEDVNAPAPGHVSLVVLPPAKDPASPWVQPDPGLLSELAEFFKDRKLLTTRLHFVGPTYIDITVSANVFLLESADERNFPAVAEAVLVRVFDPQRTSAEQSGWPFGKDVHAADVYAALDGIPGIDFVDDVVIDTPISGRAIVVDDVSVGVKLRRNELPRLQRKDIRLVIFERRGNQWQPINA